MAKSDSRYQGQPVRKARGDLSGPMYYITNPSGAVHRVGRDHAIRRLKDPRYRLSTDQEIENWMDTRIQTLKAPCGEPWDPTPDIVVNIPEPKTVPVTKIPATKGARDLALEKGVDLADVEATGSGGQIIKKDVQKFLKDQEQDEDPGEAEASEE